MIVISANDLRLALLDTFAPAVSPAQHIVDLTDVARAASTLAPEDVKRTLIDAAQQRRYAVRTGEASV